MLGGDLGPVAAAAAVLLAGVVAAAVVRSWFRQAAARREEVRVLARLAAEEAEWAEREAAAEYYSRAAGYAVPVASAKEAEVAPDAKGKGVCVVCYKPTTRRCSRCKAVKYCSNNCQVFHWRQGHKDDCQPQNNDDQFSRLNVSSKNEKSSQNGLSDVAEKAETLIQGRVSCSSGNQTTQSFPLASEIDEKMKRVHPNGVPITTSGDKVVTNEQKLQSSLKSEEPAAKEYSLRRRPVYGGDTVRTESKLSEVSIDNTSVGNRVNEAYLVSKGTKASPATTIQVGLPGGCSSAVEAYSSLSGSHQGRLVNEQRHSSVTILSSDFEYSACQPLFKSFSSRYSGNVMTKDESNTVKACQENMSGSNTAKLDGSTASFRKTSRQQAHSKLARDNTFEQMLFPYDIFVRLYHSDKKQLQPFGLINIGNGCYANVVLQCLMFTRPLTAYLLEGLHSKSCSERGWCLTCEFGNLVMKGSQFNSAQSPTGILSHLNDIGTRFGPGKQEDAHEFLRYVIDAMQLDCLKEAKRNDLSYLHEDTTLVQLIFGGYLRSKIKCTRCNGNSELCERILDLAVEIDGDIGTLEEALSRYTSTEVLDGENKYQCTRCNSYQRAKKKLTISAAPNVLTIALKRYQSGKFGKIGKSVRFPETLNLWKYMSSGSDDKVPVYSLYAVIVHRDHMNSTFSGHYICYVKDGQGKWFKVNDSQVKSARKEKVLSKCAYMLFYARCSPRAPSLVKRSMKPRDRPANWSGNIRGAAAHRPFDPADSGSDSSFFGHSDEGTSSTFSSSDSTRNSSSTEYEMLYGEADRLHTGTAHGWCSSSPSSSGQGEADAPSGDQAGAGWFDDIWASPPVLYTEKSRVRTVDVTDWGNPDGGMLPQRSRDRNS